MIRRYLSHALIYYIPSVLSVVTNIVLFPLLTKTLPLQDFGTIDLVVTAASVLTIVAALGFGTVIQHIIYAEKSADVKEIWGLVFIILLVSQTICALLFYHVGEYFLGQKVPTVPFGLLFVVTVSVSASGVLNKILSELYRYRGLATRFVILSAFCNTVYFLAVIFVYFFAKLDIKSVLLSLLISNLLYLPLIFFLMLREAKLPANFGAAPSYLKLGIVSLPIYAVAIINGYIDRWFIVQYAEVSQLGLYAVNTKIAAIVMGVLAAVNNVFLPDIVRALDDKQDQNMLVRLVDRVAMPFLVLATILIFFNKEFIHLFSKKAYFQGYSTIIFAGTGTLFILFNHLIYPFVLHAKKVKYMGAIHVLGGAANVLVNLLSIPRLGYPGAALATMVSQGVICIGTYILVRGQLREMRWIRKIGLFATAIVSCLFMSTIFPPLSDISPKEVGIKLLLVAVLAVIALWDLLPEKVHLVEGDRNE